MFVCLFSLRSFTAGLCPQSLLGFTQWALCSRRLEYISEENNKNCCSHRETWTQIPSIIAQRDLNSNQSTNHCTQRDLNSVQVSLHTEVPWLERLCEVRMAGSAGVEAQVLTSLQTLSWPSYNSGLTVWALHLQARYVWRRNLSFKEGFQLSPRVKGKEGTKAAV